MIKKGFINIIIIGVIAIIIAAAGYFAMTRKTAEAPATIQEAEVMSRTDAEKATISNFQSLITVLSPKENEELIVDKPYLIKWLSSLEISYVDIYLLKPGGACKPSIISQSISDLVPCPGSDNEPHPFYYTLAMSIPSQGSFQWTVGKDKDGKTIPSDTFYNVLVLSRSPQAYDIGDASLGVYSRPLISPVIKSASPTTGHVGAEVTLKGSGFLAPDRFGGEWNKPTIYFGEVTLEFDLRSFEVVNDNTIKFKIPAGGCKNEISAVGACLPGNEIAVTPGIYELYYWNTEKASNKIKFKVLKD